MRFLSDLAAVVIRPRSTMARILEAGPRPWHVWLLFALAALSGIFGDFDAPMLKQMIDQSGGARVLLIVSAILAGLIVILPVLFWLYAYVPYFAGRFLGGTGDIRSVRAAVAWGLAPAIWALLYRVPAAFLLVPASASSVRMKGRSVAFDPGHLAGGCGWALVFLLLELLVLVWCVVVTSNTLSEAHQYSVWHALGTIAIAAIAPFVVVLAAVLALM